MDAHRPEHEQTQQHHHKQHEGADVEEAAIGPHALRHAVAEFVWPRVVQKVVRLGVLLVP